MGIFITESHRAGRAGLVFVIRILKHVRFIGPNVVSGIGWGCLISTVLALVTLTKGLVYASAVPYFSWTAGEIGRMVVFTALWEETIFRGFLLHKLVKLWGFGWGNAATAVLFATAHMHVWLADDLRGVQLAETAVYILILGWTLGYIVHCTRSLWPAVLVHGTNNSLALLLIGTAI